MTHQDLFFLFASIYLIGGAFALNTDNALSAILFRVIPFFIGLGLLLLFFDII